MVAEHEVDGRIEGPLTGLEIIVVPEPFEHDRGALPGVRHAPDTRVLLGADPVLLVPGRADAIASKARAARERIGQYLGVIRHENQRRFPERPQVKIDDLLAHAEGRGMFRVPFPPDAIRTDIQEFHVRPAIVAFPERLEERTVFLEVNRVRVVRLNAWDALASAGGIVASDHVLKPSASRIEEPLGRGVIATAMGVAGHHAQRHRRAPALPGVDHVVDHRPVVSALLGFGVRPVETDVHDRTRKPRFRPRAALLAHPTLAGIGQERVDFAELNPHDVRPGDLAGPRAWRWSQAQQRRTRADKRQYPDHPARQP